MDHGSRLDAGQNLAVGDRMTSDDGRFELAMLDDGNLVLYSATGAVLWASNTNN